MNDEARLAKAAAAAAKANAKALRPFYKKKRWWLLGAIGIMVIASAAGMSSSDTSTGESSNGVSSGIGSNDATGDIVSMTCGKPDALGFRTPVIKVKNNSSKASDYYIELKAESADGSELIDTTLATIDGLLPGQTSKAEALPFTKELPAGSVCKIKTFQRTASN